MDFSKLKLELYDFLGIMLPGLVAIVEAWVLLRGWSPFVTTVNHLGGSGFTILAVFGFGVGHVVQEFSDASIKAFKGERFFKRGRDSFWKSEEAAPIKKAIEDQLGRQLNVDAAFDYCLSKLEGRFAKRDVFLATSDLCRSLSILSVLAVVPTIKITLSHAGFTFHFFVTTAIEVLVLILLAVFYWRRMIRFRYLSDVTAFRVYLATMKEPLTHPGS